MRNSVAGGGAEPVKRIFIMWSRSRHMLSAYFTLALRRRRRNSPIFVFVQPILYYFHNILEIFYNTSEEVSLIIHV